MAKRKRVLGNLLLLLGLVAVAGASIVALPMLRKPKPLLPPESPEVAAKRFAPENAYFTLLEARTLMPKAPEFAMVHPKDDPHQLERYVPEPGSLGELLGVGRPDDDPELVAYLDACEPAVAKAREALQRTYFLLPIDWAHCPAWDDTNGPQAKLRGMSALAKLLAARGIQAARSGDGANAVNGLLEMIRLQTLMREEYDFRGFSGSGRAGAYEMVRASSDASLDAADTELRRRRAELKPPTANLSFLLRLVASKASPLDMPSEGNAGERLLQESLKMIERTRVRSWIVEHLDELYAEVSKSPPEVDRWARIARPQMGRTYWGGAWFLQGICGMVQGTANMRILLDGSLTVIALERHRRAEGSYPETLNALTPKLIDAVPNDPYANGPLLYKRVDGDYQLYSVGMNGKDDGGGLIPEGRIVPLGDDVVIHWPRTVQS